MNVDIFTLFGMCTCLAGLLLYVFKQKTQQIEEERNPVLWSVIIVHEPTYRETESESVAFHGTLHDCIRYQADNCRTGTMHSYLKQDRDWRRTVSRGPS